MSIFRCFQYILYPFNQSSSYYLTDNTQSKMGNYKGGGIHKAIINKKDFRDLFKKEQEVVEPASQKKALSAQLVRETYPYQSIGLLFFDGNQNSTGTASLLYDWRSKTSKFLITCAHNFVYYDTDKGSIINNNKEEELKRFKLRIKSSETTIEQMKNFNKYLDIKQVHIPEEYYKELQAFKDDKQQSLNKQYKYFSKIQKDDSIYNHNYFDIAIIQLNTPIAVSNGFQLRKEKKQWGSIDLKNVEIAGYPATEQRFGSKYGCLYFQKALYRDKPANECIKLLENEGEGKGLSIIRHEISTLPGNSGSPIFEHVGNQCYLFGVHTTGVSRNSNGTHNFGTYLYGERIHSWFINIKGIPKMDESNLKYSQQ